MEYDLSTIFKNIALSVGSATAISIGIFKYFGKKWLDNKFAEKYEEYKRIQAQEFEEYKFKVNKLFNRVTKIHEKEIEVLPQAWSKLCDALGISSKLVSFMRTYHDLENMSDGALKEFLEKSNLHSHEKDELLHINIRGEKNKYYQDHIIYHEIQEAHEAFRDFHNYIIHNRIFLSADLKAEFNKIDDLIYEAIVKRQIGHEVEDRALWKEAFNHIRKDAGPIKDKIEELVQDRLRYERAK